MAGITVTSAELSATIAQVPPVRLLGMELMNEYPPAPGDWYPTNVPLDRIVAATQQQISYGTQCAKVAELLASLSPVPLDLPIAEFSI